MYLIFNKPSGSLYIISNVIPNKDLENDVNYVIVKKDDEEITRGHTYRYDFDNETVVDCGAYVPDPTEVQRMANEQEAIKYKMQRFNEYPSIGDQLDALWKGGEAAADMLAKVQAVKTKYPKPE